MSVQQEPQVDQPPEVALVESPVSLSLEFYGDREDVKELSTRIKKFMPGGEKLSEQEALVLAQYSLSMDANPFRGEVYAYVNNRGQLVLVEGYKLLVRWAKDKDHYNDTYDLLDLGDSIGYRCFILRERDRPFYTDLLAKDVPPEQAKELVMTYADGIVTLADRTKRDGKPKAPPVGWTWDQVARKRALKNTINLSHGAPSPSDIRNMLNQTTEGVVTIAADWTTEDITAGMSLEEREKLAAMHAQERERQLLAEGDTRSPAEVLAAGVAILRGPDAADPDAPLEAAIQAQKTKAKDKTGPEIRAELRESAGWVEGKEADWSDARRIPDDQQLPPDPVDVAEAIYEMTKAFSGDVDTLQDAQGKIGDAITYVFKVPQLGKLCSQELTALHKYIQNYTAPTRFQHIRRIAEAGAEQKAAKAKAKKSKARKKKTAKK